MEHRWGRRRQVTLRVRIGGPGHHSALGRLTNISLSGGYVRTAAMPSLVSQMHVEIDAHRADNAGHLRLQGRVVRHGLKGMGLEWEEFASETLCEILRIATPSHPDSAAQRQRPRKIRAIGCSQCIT